MLHVLCPFCLSMSMLYVHVLDACPCSCPKQHEHVCVHGACHDRVPAPFGYAKSVWETLWAMIKGIGHPSMWPNDFRKPCCQHSSKSFLLQHEKEKTAGKSIQPIGNKKTNEAHSSECHGILNILHSVSLKHCSSVDYIMENLQNHQLVRQSLQALQKLHVGNTHPYRSRSKGLF
jgi:hypothetical protein